MLLDGFCGTGSVAVEALRRGVPRVIAIDNLVSNTVILRGFGYRPPSPTRWRSLLERIEELNRLPGEEGYATLHFAGTYFTPDNCRRMDAVRDRLERWRAASQIDEGEHAFLLAGFLLAADRVANTVGQYDAFLKHIGLPSKRDGRHLVDDRVYSRFQLLTLTALPPGVLEVLTGDLLSLAPMIEADTAYLDPPYNGRQYCDCYHVLENLARWEKPPVAGKTKKLPRDGLKSPFSSRRSVAPSFRKLLDLVRAPEIYLSYSSEGLLGREELEGLLGAYGAVAVHRFPYPVFGSGAGVARKRDVTEYLFHLRRDGRVG